MKDSTKIEPAQDLSKASCTESGEYPTLSVLSLLSVPQVAPRFVRNPNGPSLIPVGQGMGTLTQKDNVP
jgi:hypothetical protein